MTRRGRVAVVLLVEDERHQRFLYRYFHKRGFERHLIRSKVAPAGRGSAEQWVRERYPKEVHECRTRSTQIHLLVMIDADTGPVARRLSQLERALDEARLPRREKEEPIAHLVPKRNIETWILCLNNQPFKGQPINEQEDYKPYSDTLRIDGQIDAAADVFYSWSRRNAKIPERCVDSLRSAIPEVRRLD